MNGPLFYVLKARASQDMDRALSYWLSKNIAIIIFEVFLLDSDLLNISVSVLSVSWGFLDLMPSYTCNQSKLHLWGFKLKYHSLYADLCGYKSQFGLIDIQVLLNWPYFIKNYLLRPCLLKLQFPLNTAAFDFLWTKLRLYSHPIFLNPTFSFNQLWMITKSKGMKKGLTCS